MRPSRGLIYEAPAMLVNYAPSDRVSAAANCMPDVSNEALKEHVNAIGMPLGGGSGIGTHR